MLDLVPVATGGQASDDGHPEEATEQLDCAPQPRAAPTLSGASVPMMASEAGAMTSPIPRPMHPKAIPTMVNPDWTVTKAKARPAVTSSMPTINSPQPVPLGEAGGGVGGEEGPGGQGKEPSPTPNALAPWTNWMYWLRR